MLQSSMAKDIKNEFFKAQKKIQKENQATVTKEVLPDFRTKLLEKSKIIKNDAVPLTIDNLKLRDQQLQRQNDNNFDEH